MYFSIFFCEEIKKMGERKNVREGGGVAWSGRLRKAAPRAIVVPRPT
jgi:hypothetical protein